RDKLVTGVQTCALPISASGNPPFILENTNWRSRQTLRSGRAFPATSWRPRTDWSKPEARAGRWRMRVIKPHRNGFAFNAYVRYRSEERRVGKEWRTWGG